MPHVRLASYWLGTHTFLGAMSKLRSGNALPCLPYFRIHKNSMDYTLLAIMRATFGCYSVCGLTQTVLFLSLPQTAQGPVYTPFDASFRILDPARIMGK
ncbi:hypothetical protein SCLCIDRAFT_162595 [Scleroderma citrinum Foug A]|uniref:Uncharacterized protein n=1 Tax=Scleroderma citrinum Foug A TaxID=1036808 RepID=A0A0C3AAB0_9AGAM|nr:hypothetical protein SCLCIDRAFT_162595 [Scleroderma citrinum Foug A]